MSRSIKIEIRPEEIIEAVMRMKKREREAFLEDLIAATSMVYLKSIQESRADLAAGRIETHEAVFDR